MLSKKAVVDIKIDNEYYEFIERERVKRDLSFTAYVKYLVFEKIDDLKKEEAQLKSHVVPVVTEEVVEKKEKKRDMLKNLNNIKK